MSGFRNLGDGGKSRGKAGELTRAGGWGRCVFLAVILVALRLPFVGHPAPVHPDELSFVSAIGFPAEYPVQHPGYPGWVALGTLASWMGVGSYWAYAMWSMAASAIGPVIAYRVFRRFLGEGTAWWLGLALGVNPLMWFMSVTALTFPLATAIGLGTVLLAVKAEREKKLGMLVAAIGALVLGMLVRGDLGIYLGLLVLGVNATVAAKSKMWIAPALLLVAALAFVSATRLAYLRGDEAAVAARLAHTQDVVLNTSVFRAGLVDGLLRNVIKIGVNLGWDLGLAFPVFVFSVGYLARCWRAMQPGAWLVGMWLAPGLLFLACFHVVQGYFLILLPAALLCIGLALERWRGVVVARRAAIGIVVASAVQFLAYPWSVESTGWKRTVDGKIGFLSRAGLMGIDQRERIHEDGDFWRTGAHESPH
ncbi:MAG: hypothetical protein IPK83_23505 [Planctomycetes bacterium]|nr:hypothetical protein [Planctomycetota bacterium]